MKVIRFGLVVFVQFALFDRVLCLDCWTCVGTDCDGPMDDSKFARRTKCEEGAECQKTYFYYFDFVKNTSEKVGPIRSCSYPTGCAPLDEFATGVCDNWKYYQSLGCVKRWCCNSDFCNGISRPTFPLFALITLSLAQILNNFHH